MFGGSEADLVLIHIEDGVELADEDVPKDERNASSIECLDSKEALSRRTVHCGASRDLENVVFRGEYVGLIVNVDGNVGEIADIGAVTLDGADLGHDVLEEGAGSSQKRSASVDDGEDVFLLLD